MTFHVSCQNLHTQSRATYVPIFCSNFELYKLLSLKQLSIDILICPQSVVILMLVLSISLTVIWADLPKFILQLDTEAGVHLKS